MTRRQLEEDVFNAESEHDFDPEEDIAQYEHYRVYGNRPRLMPDLSRNRGLDCVADALFSFTGDSIH